MHVTVARLDEPLMGKKDAMSANNTAKVELPSWVFPMLVTLLIAFLGNLGASAYWAGQLAADQRNTANELRELKSEVKQLQGINTELREKVAGVTAAASRR